MSQEIKKLTEYIQINVWNAWPPTDNDAITKEPRQNIPWDQSKKDYVSKCHQRI